MIICNYYRGGTDKLSGFVYDTEKKTYKEFTIVGEDWTDTVRKKAPYKYIGERIYSVHKPGFKVPGDISYFFQTKSDMTDRLETIKQLGFTKDDVMILDFGIFKL